jgi:hypothetical protein
VGCGVDLEGLSPGCVRVRYEGALEFWEGAVGIGGEGEGGIATDAGVGEEDVEVGGQGVDPLRE